MVQAQHCQFATSGVSLRPVTFKSEDIKAIFCSLKKRKVSETGFIQYVVYSSMYLYVTFEQNYS